MRINLPTTVPSINIGGRVFTDLANLKTLYAFGAYNGKNSTFRLFSASAGYQVTSGKTLRIMALRCAVVTAEANQYIRLGYSDNDVGLSGSTAYTNHVYIGGQNVASSFMLLGATGVQEYACQYTVPSQKYPSMEIFASSTGVAHVMAFGYEE